MVVGGRDRGGVLFVHPTYVRTRLEESKIGTSANVGVSIRTLSSVNITLTPLAFATRLDSSFPQTTYTGSSP